MMSFLIKQAKFMIKPDNLDAKRASKKGKG